MSLATLWVVVPLCLLGCGCRHHPPASRQEQVGPPTAPSYAARDSESRPPAAADEHGGDSQHWSETSHPPAHLRGINGRDHIDYIGTVLF